MEWRLTSSDGNTSESLSALHITPTVEQVVFEFQLNGEERISRIRFEDVERYNGTTIQCALTGSFNNSPAATLRVFGKCTYVAILTMLSIEELSLKTSRAKVYLCEPSRFSTASCNNSIWSVNTN